MIPSEIQILIALALTVSYTVVCWFLTDYVWRLKENER